MRISDWSSDVCPSDRLIDEDVARRLRFVVRPIGTVDVDHHALARIDPFIAAAQDAGVVHKGLLPRGLFAALAEEWSHREPVTPLLEEKGDACEFGALISQLLRPLDLRSEEHTSELQSLMRISYAVFCLKKKNIKTQQ